MCVAALLRSGGRWRSGGQHPVLAADSACNASGAGRRHAGCIMVRVAAVGDTW